MSADRHLSATLDSTDEWGVDLKINGRVNGAKVSGGFGAPSGDKARPAGEGFQHPVSHQIRGRPPRPGPGSVDLGGTVEEA